MDLKTVPLFKIQDIESTTIIFMINKYLLHLLLFLSCSCSQNKNGESENTQRKIDSLSNELNKVKENSNTTQNNSSETNNNSNINSSQGNKRYGFVSIAFEKRYFTIRGDLGAYTISEEEGLRRNYIKDMVEIEKKRFLSDIEEIDFFNDDIEYKMLDEYEQVLREKLSMYDPKHNEFSFKIISRELKLFPSYATASHAKSQLKGISD